MAHKQVLKRILPILAGVGVVAAGASSVVSCTAPQWAAGPDGERVVVSTDGGHINDGSFNEDAFTGVQNFLSDAFGMSHQETKGNYVEAGGTDTTSIVSGYRLAVLKKANAVVLPGFAHANALPQALNFFQKNNVNVILVDSAVPTGKNVVNIQFNSQISGVMAGFDTSYLMGTNPKKYDTNGDGKIKIGTFAGASNKYGVDNYMWGLLLGMQLYNDEVETIKKTINPDAIPVETANPTSASGDKASGNIKDVQTVSANDPGWYTNSFAQGGATQSGILTKLIDDNGADVIFPVAGPQILDVLGFKRQHGRAPYVIGVDVDQAAEYGKGNEGRFVTSAIKNIDTAVPEALYRASDDDGSGNTLKPSKDTSDSKYGGWEAGKKEHWLGKQPNPYANWSIDYTNSNAPLGGHYLLQQNYIKLYDPNNTMESAEGAMKDINTYFANLGDTSTGYMIGSKIYEFAQELIDRYAPKFIPGGKGEEPQLDFYGEVSKDTNSPWWIKTNNNKTNNNKTN